MCLRVRGLRLRLCLRRGRAVSDLSALYRKQANWFRAERSRLLRKADIARRRVVLDLGTGTGEILAELRRRCDGRVVGVDKDADTLRDVPGETLVAEATNLPFADGTFDLVFTQMFFLWAAPLEAVIREIRRVLASGGHLVAAAEPDFGGVIEFPDDCCGMARFVRGLAAEGADPRIARKLGGSLMQAGFTVEAGSHTVDPLGSPGEKSPPCPTGGAFLAVPYFWFFATR